MKRRKFLQHSVTLGAAALFTAPFNIIHAQSKKGELIGHGDFRYRVNRDWGRLDRAAHPVKDCHEMVMDSKKRLIMLTNETKNNILIYDKSGKLLDSWGHRFPGGHGLTLHNENGEEFLYITDIDLGEVYKTTLTGEVLLTIRHPKTIGQYDACDKFMPTETCIGPTGDIYVADGYGSQFVLQYSPQGEFIRKFGGNSYQPDKFKQVHGIALDTRDPNNPVLLCTDRMKNCFKRFSLDGQYLDSIHLPGAYMSRPVIDGDMVYSGVCFSALQHYMLTYNSGFVTILDKHNKVVSNPGGTRPRYKQGELELMVQDKPIFKHCHDVCVDDDKNLYICQWNADGVYPYKLERV
ncbi:MAG: 6-bladed beta-propeller [Candidatus Pseudobacter hemicellulosilyticus]|uniref:6-bladed beta-propeller n=1 Tax=Candidatus Pseudobacter hemicellulosilyticus TaxID=3121375 RepID=A0AAJ5WX43_9BACT|nr:MAG: 6-bladed beta-propeller [Pseudobacter sp.]